MVPRQDTGRRVASTRCPFLVEGTARCCGLAPFRKLVPELAIAERDQSCSSAAWRSCAWVRRQDAVDGQCRAIQPVAESGDQCPFLDEMIACSCAAASSSKLIPKTLLAASRCLGDSHRYCDFFLERMCPPPGGASDRAGSTDVPATGPVTIPVPAGMALAPNHMWFDVGPDGSCHVGIDAFLVRVLGAVDEVIFLSSCNFASPSLALTAAGTTLPLVFPRRLYITRVNSALRRHPGDLTADPYHRGWLYEGRVRKRPGRTAIGATTAGLRRGPDAEMWMASEVKRLSRHVRTILSRRSSHLGPVAADGGEISGALAQHLERAELLEIFSLFFSGAAE
jgi:glycine cleavage system H lipoate-binding protein